MDSIPAPLEQTAFGEHVRKRHPIVQLLRDVMESILIAVVIYAVIHVFLFTPNIVHGPSMLPTFEENQLVLTSSRIAHWLGNNGVGQGLGFNYQRGEVVVFHKSTGEDLIKRIIALPDEKVMIKSGKVYVNGEYLPEPYLSDQVTTTGGSYLAEGEEITVSPGFYFLMGDNRENSQDSRDLRVGQVHRDSILGKVLVRYWPPQSFKIFRPNTY